MEIFKIPNKIFAGKTTLVPAEHINKSSLKELILDMKKVMKEHQGVGLAANQVGKDLSIFVIDEKLAQESEAPDVYINPDITEYSKEQDEMEEGCLSIPAYYMLIKRSKKVKIKFIDEAGKKRKLKARGFLARVLQHETDHLNGLTIKNRATQPLQQVQSKLKIVLYLK